MSILILECGYWFILNVIKATTVAYQPASKSKCRPANLLLTSLHGV